MPANMMIDPAGSSLKVIGSPSATVSAGPIPGRTPTAVPSSTPMRAKSRFRGWTATVSPWAREARTSIGTPISCEDARPIPTIHSGREKDEPPSNEPLQRPDGKAQGQELGEEQIGRRAEHEADDEIGQDGAASE